MVKAAVKLSCHDNVHATENMLRMSLSTVYLKQSLLLSYLVTPEEALVGLTLKGLSHKSSEPWTVSEWRAQKLVNIRRKKKKKKKQHWWK